MCVVSAARAENLKSYIKPILRPARRKVASLRLSTSRWAEFAWWSLFRSPPRLNASSAARHVDTRLPADSVPLTETGGRLHVRIVFHYTPWRLKYLIETMKAASELPFEEIDIWIDTNTPQLSDKLKDLPYRYRIKVWDALDHPFKLTWMHRPEMLKRLDQFDAFMYLEDDIIVPAKTMRRWLRETPRLQPLGFLPGFVRVEESHAGDLVLADYIEGVSRSHIREIDGRPYLCTPYPYQACWIYDAAQMREMASMPNYLSGEVQDLSLFERDGPPGMREQVALGLQFTAIPEGCASRALIPLTDDLKVAADALVFHAPSNYAQSVPPNPAGLGQLALDDILPEEGGL